MSVNDRMDAAHRSEWVDLVTKLVAARQAITAQWALSSKVSHRQETLNTNNVFVQAGMLESKEFADNMSEWHRTQQDQLSYYGTGRAVLEPKKLDDFASPKTLLPLRTVYDIYTAAEMAKGLWDMLLLNVAKRLKLETRAGTDGSAWYDDRISKISERRQQLSEENAAAIKREKRGTLQGSQRPDNSMAFVGGLITMPLKAKERALQKAAQNYADVANGLPITYVADIVRSSVVCTSEVQVFGVVKALYTTANVKVIEVRNRFKRPAPNGYRDILIKAYVSFVDEKGDDDDGDSGGICGLLRGFICELQVHHLDLYLVAADRDAYSTYTYFRGYFGSTADAAAMALRLKVLKKMDQISNDASQLEDFVENFLSSEGRASRDHVRLKTFFELFRMTGEVALAERLMLRVVALLRDRPKHQSLLPESLSDLAMLFRQQRRYKDALPFCEEALAVSREINGEDHMCTAQLISLLADIFACQKLFDRALSPLLLTAGIRRRCCGESHPSFIVALKLLAENYEEQRDWQSARAAYKQLLPLTIGLFGNNSPEVINVLTCLGNIEELVGDFPLAVQYHADALDMCCIFFGKSHPSVATSTVLLASNYENMGMTARALELQVLALNIRLSTFGLEHDSTAESYLNVASILFELGKVSKAVYFAEESLRVRRALLTDTQSDHQLRLADSMALLGEILYNSIDYLAHYHDFIIEGDEESQSEYDEYVVIYRKVLAILERSKKLIDGAYVLKVKVHGVDHISVHHIMHHQTILSDLIRFRQLEHEYHCESSLDNSTLMSAKEGAFKKLVTAEVVVSNSQADDASLANDGESTIATAASHLSLRDSNDDGVVDGTRGIVESKENPSPAKGDTDKKRTQVSVKRPPPKSAREMESATNLDETLQKCHNLLLEMVESRDKSEYQTARDIYYEQASDMLRSARSYNASHTVSAILLSHLGCWYEDQRLFGNAEVIFNDVLRILHEIYGTDIDHRHLAQSFFNYATALKCQQRYAESLPYYEKARDMFLRLDRVAQENKFKCYYFEKETSTALRFDVGELLSSEPSDESHSIEACSAEHSMAQCFTGLGRYEDASYHISKALSSRQHLLGENHPDTSSSLNSLGIALTALGRVQEGLDALDKCLIARDKIVGQKHQAYGTISSNVALSNYLYNDMAKAGRSSGVAYDIAFPFFVSGDFVALLKNLVALFGIQGDETLRDQLVAAVGIISSQNK